MHIRPTLALLLAAPLSAQLPNWTEIKPTTSPAGRQNSAMAYDSTRGRCVLFGGWNGSARANDTWEWDGTNWTRITTATTPSGRDAIALAYDANRRVTVMSGGYGNSSETWEYDGTDWVQRSSATTHNLGAHVPMVYDTRRKVCVMSNGASTREWDGTNWTSKNTTNQPPRSGPMAYDSLRQVIVFLAGTQTWEYDGSSWTQAVTATNPSNRSAQATMVYDAARQVVIVFGGCGGSGRETWEYDGIDWRRSPTVASPTEPRCYVAMAYDSKRQRTVLFGGRDESGASAVLQADTWEHAGRPCRLQTEIFRINARAGGVQQFVVDGGTARAGYFYWIFGSVTGTAPGLALNGVHFPLNPDIYTELAILATNGANLVNFRGVLDRNGRATARLVVPSVPSGADLHHAALVHLGTWECATNSVATRIQ